MKNLQPTLLEDIIAANSLVRPDDIDNYINAKNSPDKIKYKHGLLKLILEVTYGCIVYQEQIMQILKDLGDFSLGQSDEIRRAMSKKHEEEIKAQKHIPICGIGTIKGAVSRGVPAEVADEIFEQIIGATPYVFDKSHATAYSVVTYQTAYLKRYHNVEFMESVSQWQNKQKRNLKT